MERVCALALCLLLSLCSATSPPKLPTLTPLHCNETKGQAELAVDLINEDRDDGFIIKPIRLKSIFEQRVEKVAGASLYYIDFEASETPCSVLSGKKWKECNDARPFHEQVTGECKAIIYIARPWRILKLLNYNCTLGTVPSRKIISTCPDCPMLVKDITEDIKVKAGHMVEKFNKGSNQTHYFKVDEIERVRTQWMIGQSYFILFTIKETDCLKIQKKIIVLNNCNSLQDHEAHVGFCVGGSYIKPDRTEEYSVTCEIYNPRDDNDHHHHHKHGHCDHGKEGAEVEKDAGKQSETGAGEGGPSETGQEERGQSKDVPEKCEYGKGKDCGRRHRHHCHRHPHHHHHHGPHHHHRRGPHHHHHHHHHDNSNHSHSHDPAHHHHDHHNHTSDGHGSSSEEITDKQPFRRIKGSVQVYYLDENTASPPVPTIFQLPGSKKHLLETADFPNEPSPLQTCPSSWAEDKSS